MTPFQTNRDGKNRTEKISRTLVYTYHRWFKNGQSGDPKERRGRPRKHCKDKPTV